MIITLLVQTTNDSLRIINQSNQPVISNDHFRDNLSFYVGIAGFIIGVIGTLLAVIGYLQQRKAKRIQEYIFKQAEIALEKEDSQNKLKQTKEELSEVESKINVLQKQIQKDLPIEARKAVLKDRLDESMKNLNRYFEDVKDTKQKLSTMGVDTEISEELLNSIEDEIESKYVIKEKIYNYQAVLTVLSTLSGICFAAIPYPVGNWLGILLLLAGLPYVVLLAKNIRKRTKNEAKPIVNYKTLTLLLNAVLAILIVFVVAISWFIFLATYYSDNTDILYILIPISITIVSVLAIIWLWKSQTLQNTSKKQEL